jgi:hypothetical protein
MILEATLLAQLIGGTTGSMHKCTSVTDISGITYYSTDCPPISAMGSVTIPHLKCDDGWSLVSCLSGLDTQPLPLVFGAVDEFSRMTTNP